MSKFVHIKQEGKEIQQGINYYPLSDKYSVGFVFLLGLWFFRMRWSKVAKKVFVSGGRYE